MIVSERRHVLCLLLALAAIGCSDETSKPKKTSSHATHQTAGAGSHTDPSLTAAEPDARPATKPEGDPET